MKNYDIYILSRTGATSLTITGGSYSSDSWAIGAARDFAHGMPFEVWCGMDVIKSANGADRPAVGIS